MDGKRTTDGLIDGGFYWVVTQHTRPTVNEWDGQFRWMRATNRRSYPEYQVNKMVSEGDMQLHLITPPEWLEPTAAMNTEDMLIYSEGENDEATEDVAEE